MAGASILHFARMNHAMPIRATGHSNDAPNGFMTNAPMPAPKMDAAMPRAFLPALNFGGGATAEWHGMSRQGGSWPAMTLGVILLCVRKPSQNNRHGNDEV